MYGDHIHSNDGTHLKGGIADDKKRQRRWQRVVSIDTKRWEAPNRKVGNQFVNMLAAEWKGVRTRKWNSERPIIFGAIILQKAYGLRKSCDIRKCIVNRMKLWEEGRFVALITDMEANARLSSGGGTPQETDETIA